LPPIKWWNRSKGKNYCRFHLTFLARGDVLCCAKEHVAVLEPVLELVIGLNLVVNYPEIRRSGIYGTWAGEIDSVPCWR
jgi:hypothetical protein